jgi:hypothetical protein
MASDYPFKIVSLDNKLSEISLTQCCVLSGEATNTNCIVFEKTRTEPISVHHRGGSMVNKGNNKITELRSI